MPPVLVDLIERLVRSGHCVELRAVFYDSYVAEVRDLFGVPVGNIEYRSPLDEPTEHARGLSYASFDIDVQQYPDRTFALIRLVVGK